MLRYAFCMFRPATEFVSFKSLADMFQGQRSVGTHGYPRVGLIWCVSAGNRPVPVGQECREIHGPAAVGQREEESSSSCSQSATGKGENLSPAKVGLLNFLQAAESRSKLMKAMAERRLQVSENPSESLDCVFLVSGVEINMYSTKSHTTEVCGRDAKK